MGLGCKGHWVLNKQAPNKEIWWSSPIRYYFSFLENVSVSYIVIKRKSGPKRFRPVIGSAGQVLGGASNWIDVRGSGETLLCIFTKEIGSVLNIDLNNRQD